MNFDRLYSLIIESNSTSFQEYDNWVDFIDDESDIFNIEELGQFVDHFQLSVRRFMDNYYIQISDQSNTIWFEYDNDVYSKIADSDDDMKYTIQRMADHDKIHIMKISEDDIYISGWESTIGDMCRNGNTVYHYTTKEGLKKIRDSGEIRPSWGSGLSNRGTKGIFTSVSPETYADGTYGDIMVEIDLTAYMKDYKLPRLDLQPEPDVMEASINGIFMYRLGFEDYDEYVSSDMSPETVIVGEVIPVKYIKIID